MHILHQAWLLLAFFSPEVLGARERASAPLMPGVDPEGVSATAIDGESAR
jgi:hypothetical protein